MTIYGYRSFNNYYNRKVKGQSIDNITDFMKEFGEFNYIQTDTYGNFNEKDGVSTTHVLGNQNDPYFGDCDYLLVCNDNNKIDSRWFIIDQDKLCYGQYKLSLYRDVIVDNWNNIISAPMFIEKATLQDSDPLIYNQEAITTNQIKQSELLLKDESSCGWLIGYLNKDYENTTAIEIPINTVEDHTVNTTSDIRTFIGALADYTYRRLVKSGFEFEVFYQADFDLLQVKYKITEDSAEMISYKSNATNPNNKWCYTGFDSPEELAFTIKNAINFTTVRSLIPQELNGFNDTAYNSILNHQNQVFYVSDVGKYKKISVRLENKDQSSSIPVEYQLFTLIINSLNSITDHTGSGLASHLTCKMNNNTCRYTLVDDSSQTYKITIGSKTERIHCKDVFDLFCMPYGNIIITNSKVSNFTNCTYNKDQALSLMQSLTEQLGTNVYDVQLVPYCPLTGLQYTTQTVDGEEYRVIDINNANGYRYKMITDIDGHNKGVIIFSASNKGTKDIACNLAVTNKKLQNQTQIVRLSSPNYSAQFDFNIAKNNGVNYFNVDYNYLPYRPYIHVAPIWNEDGIYGGDYNDAKGLICGGDFSISYLSDAWVNYQVQNKNFETIFKRGTENLETNYKYQKIQAGISAGVGGLSGAVAAGTTGGLIGGPVGAVVGGLIGGALSAGAGIGDLIIQKNLHNEAMDYRKDLYDMQLDNIKALPDTIKTVTAINENNKIFPFIEIYDCTEREKIAVANKIAWNGMTVGVIGTLRDYIYNNWSYKDITDKGYIKGQLIRAEGISDDTHLLNAIADELNKGVFTK